MLQAFDDTIALARFRAMRDPQAVASVIEGTTLAHLVDMRSRITPEFSDAKLGRWLGWAQAVVVMHGYATLDDMKAINMALRD